MADTEGTGEAADKEDTADMAAGKAAADTDADGTAEY